MVETGSSSRAQEGTMGIDPELLIDINDLHIGSSIGEGSHSTVCDGRYKTMPVAVKILQQSPKSTSTITELKEKFIREVTMFSRVKHDNLVKFIGATIEPSMLIIMEIMRGGSLTKHLLDMRPNRPDLKTSINFALDIARVMERLHANRIIHRDLKPGNLLLTEDKRKLKLADFGLAREETVEEMMSSEAGTYRWMAPELYSTASLKRGEKIHYDHKVDIYSFAMVLWELLNNTQPFEGMNGLQAAYAAAQNKRPSVDDLPAELVPLLQSCWSNDPASRPEFTEIRATLSEFLNSLDVPINQHSPVNATEQQIGNQLPFDSPGTRHLMDESGQRKKSPRFLSCFEQCFPKGRI